MSKATDSARGEPCEIRLPGICNHDPATTVACHANGGGWGMKQLDSEIAYGCSDCHRVVDGQRSSADICALEAAYGTNWPLHLKIDFLEAQQRTRVKLFKKGLMIIK